MQTQPFFISYFIGFVIFFTNVMAQNTKKRMAKMTNEAKKNARCVATSINQCHTRSHRVIQKESL